MRCSVPTSRVPRRLATLAGLAATIVVAAAALVGTASPAGAHATLIATSPAADAVVDGAPDQVELQFDEPVETAEGAVQVFGPDGDRVDLGSVETADGGATLRARIDAADQGTYTVAWRVTSEDSHTLTGSFVFHNGTRTGGVVVDDGSDTTTEVAGAVGRWLSLAGTLVAVGAATMALLLRPATARLPAGASRRTPGDDRGAVDPSAAATTARSATGTGTNDPTTGTGPNDPATDDSTNNPTTGTGPNDPASGDTTNNPTTGTGPNNPATGDTTNNPTTGTGPNDPTTGTGPNDPATGDSTNSATTGTGPNNPTTGTSTNNPTTGIDPNDPATGDSTNDAAVGGTGDRPAADDTGHDIAISRLRTLALAGALAGTAGAFLSLVAILAEGSGRNVYDALALVTDTASDTRTGRLLLLRVALGAAAGATAAIVAVWRRTSVPTLALASAALVATTIGGHAWTAPNRSVAVAADLAHLGAAAVWAGGLVALLLVLPDLARSGRTRLAARFSALALGAVAVVAASGTVSAWQQVRTLDGLTSTTYGRLVLAKVAGLAVLVVLGWVNRSRLVPLVGRTVAPLRRSLRAEVAVAALVLAVTAALIHEPPARTEVDGEPFVTSVEADGGERAEVTVDPATAGTNDIHLYFYAGGGEPLAVDAVQVTAATADVPARRLQVTPVSTNHVVVAGASLPSAGTWTVEVTAVQAGEPLVFTVEVPIA